MLQDGSNYVWQLAWVINEFIPRYPTLFSPRIPKALIKQISDYNNPQTSNSTFLFQIRAEKPYYMADPEVDSLVSLLSTLCDNCSPKLCFSACATFSRHTTLTAKVKKVMKMHICISRPERAKRFWIVFLTLMVHKLRIELPKNIFCPFFNY